MKFQRATKRKIKLRLALYGPSGSGKTYTALAIATGMGGRIAVVDTERQSASRYADRFEFDSLDLSDRSPAGYIEAISAAEEAGYDVIVIDSLSHAWQSLLDFVDRAANASKTGNTWAQWSKANPQHRALVDRILTSGCHIICTMRSKTEWAIEQNERGKSAPRRIGLAPEQGKGIEYEFDMVGSLNQSHWMTVEKDRTGKYQDQEIETPGIPFGRELIAWLNDGAEATPVPPAPTPDKTEPSPMSGHWLAWQSVPLPTGATFLVTHAERIRPSQKQGEYVVTLAAHGDFDACKEAMESIRDAGRGRTLEFAVHNHRIYSVNQEAT